MAVQLALLENESVIREHRGDYWEGAVFSSQKTGCYYFTNKMIRFRGGFIAALDLPYADIASVSLCNVGGLIKFLPTGILVTMKDGKKYRLSVMKRKEIMELIQTQMRG